jgi:hypothetical protein
VFDGHPVALLMRRREQTELRDTYNEKKRRL